MKNFLFLLFCTTIALSVTAGSLPDCSHPSYDQERRLIIVKDNDRTNMEIIRILSSLEHDRALSTSLLPIFHQGQMTIHARFHRCYESSSRQIIDRALLHIASKPSVAISCVLYQPQET